VRLLRVCTQNFSYVDPDYLTSGLTMTGLTRVYCIAYTSVCVLTYGLTVTRYRKGLLYWLHLLMFCILCHHINYIYYNYENNQQDALYRLIYYSKSALHVSGDVFAYHQEHLTVFTVSGSAHPSCCQPVPRIRDTSRQQLGCTLPDTVNTVKCYWWWAKTSPKTCRAD
jgi:hypothetical protein